MIKYLTNNEYQKVINENEIVLIDFFATWCSPCQMLGPVLEELDKENMNCQICKVDVDKEKELSQKFGVTSIPAIFVVRNQKPVRKALGYRSLESLKNMITFDE